MLSARPEELRRRPYGSMTYAAAAHRAIPDSTMASSEMSQRRLVMLEREVDEGLGKVRIEVEQRHKHACRGHKAALPGRFEVLGQAIGGRAKEDDGDPDDLGGDVKRRHQARAAHGNECVHAKWVMPVDKPG